MLPLLLLLAGAPPEVAVTHDDTVITESCTVRIAPGTVIADTNGDGVIHIAADGVTVEFAEGSVLRGANTGVGPGQTPWDKLTGIGVRVDGRKNVTLRNVRVQGYKVGLYATASDALSIEGGEFSDNFRQRLGSTPRAEDGADWLWPHKNDDREWMTNYGAAAVVERSSGVTIRGVRVRRGQNGIIIDRVRDSKIFDNDCSFLSGWGLAMWRSGGNTISRNALDFCVRGHSEGVYNRGQDSAGILCFEQCSGNVFVENSVTHGGDGFFGFAGREALGEAPAPSPDFDYKAAGCNGNSFVANDFSYAPAHGLELTFSENNIVVDNRFVENAICGIWGGYSNGFVIAQNEFTANGGMAYGLERGGVNIEHGGGNVILANTFTNNAAAVHLWWDDDGRLLSMPGVKARYRGVADNRIVLNTILVDRSHPFRSDRHRSLKLYGVQLRDAGAGHISGTVYSENDVRMDADNAVELDLAPGVLLDRSSQQFAIKLPNAAQLAIGETRPVGARSHLRGRSQIIMGEWGPWDHESPLIRTGARESGRHVYEIFGGAATVAPGAPQGVQVETAAQPEGPTVVTISAGPGVHAYEIPLSVGAEKHTLSGTLIGTTWEVTVFPWTAAADPRENLEAWRGLSRADGAVKSTTPALKFAYAHRGPKDLAWNDEVRRRGPGGDHFGMIATSRVRLPAGRWKVATLSDDGVRVLVDGKPVIENWTWHAPTRNEGVIDHPADGEIELTVEHFEIDGYAVLELDLEPAK